MSEKIISDVSQRKNRGLLLGEIRKNAPVSRSELVQITGLNKATVSNIIKDFLEVGVVRNAGMVAGDGGRKKVGLALNMDQYVCIVLRMTKYHIKSGLYSACDRLRNFREVRYTDTLDIEAILSQLHDEIEIQLRYGKEERLEILGISLATLGYLIEKNNSYQIRADGFRTLSETDFSGMMRKWYPGYTILVNHDANVSAFAELEKYVREGNETPAVLLNIIGDIGLGGGIVIDGKIMKGYHGVAGEVGHLGIHGADLGEDNYRKSILEEYSSPAMIVRTVHETCPDFEGTVLGKKSTLEDIYAAYEEGDPLASYALNKSARYLAYGIAGLIFTLDPEVIVLGDRIVRSQKYQKALQKCLEEFLPEILRMDQRLRFSDFEEDSAIIGAGKILFDEIMRNGSIIDHIVDHVNRQRFYGPAQ